MGRDIVTDIAAGSRSIVTIPTRWRCRSTPPPWTYWTGSKGAISTGICTSIFRKIPSGIVFAHWRMPQHSSGGSKMRRKKGELSPAAIDRGWPHQIVLPARRCEGGGYEEIHEFWKNLTLCSSRRTLISAFRTNREQESTGRGIAGIFGPRAQHVVRQEIGARKVPFHRSR